MFRIKEKESHFTLKISIPNFLFVKLLKNDDSMDLILSKYSFEIFNQRIKPDEIKSKLKRIEDLLDHYSFHESNYTFCMIQLNFDEKKHKFLMSLATKDNTIEFSIKEKKREFAEHNNSNVVLKELLGRYFQGLLVG